MIGRSIRLLLADDNRDFCEVFHEFFTQQEGLNLVGIAYNGLEAVQMIKESRPDVVLLDIIMPHLDGIGVLEKFAVSCNGQRPKFVMLTPLEQKSFTKRGLELGPPFLFLNPFYFNFLAS